LLIPTELLIQTKFNHHLGGQHSFTEAS